jgi:HK97 family phage major capsid protein
VKKKPKAKERDQYPDLQIRAGELEIIKRAKGEGAAEVRMSVSSEKEVLTVVYLNDMWQRAYEILDHSPGSVDMSRAKDGLVILDRHYGDQIGLMKARIENRKLGGLVQFGSGPRAQEIGTDAKAGIRRNVSVGYQVDTASYQIEGDRDGVPVVRAMSWMPYEASFEPVPADTTVGVGRSAKSNKADQKPAATEERKMDPKEMAALFARAAKYGIEASEVQKLIDDGKGRAELDAMIVDKQSGELDGARNEITTLKERKPEKPEENQPPVGPLGGSRDDEAKIARRYSVMNVLRVAAGIDNDPRSGKKIDLGFEREIDQECRKYQTTKGHFVIPHAVLGKRDFSVSGTSSASVETDLRADEFIDLLRTYMVLGQAGVDFMPGLVGNVAIPKMTAGCTGYWVTEGGDITESQPTLGQVTMNPKTCGVMTDITRRMLLQSTPSAEEMVRNEIVERIARTVQIAVFQGSGAAGQPSAITNASGINNPSVTQGTPTYAEMLGFPGNILADSAPMDNQKWIGTAEVWEKLAGTAKDSGSGLFVLDTETNKMLGREFLVTEDVGANSLFFGAWRTVMIGIWGAGIDLNYDTATLSSSGGLRIVGLQDVDVAVRLGEALAYNTAVTS